jgi:hypothetical protein
MQSRGKLVARTCNLRTGRYGPRWDKDAGAVCQLQILLLAGVKADRQAKAAVIPTYGAQVQVAKPRIPCVRNHGGPGQTECR